MKALEPRSPNAWLAMAGCVVATVDVERASLPPDVASLVTVVIQCFILAVTLFFSDSAAQRLPAFTYGLKQRFRNGRSYRFSLCTVVRRRPWP